MKIENEVWKNILGFEGQYQVSDKGRVKSLKQGKENILKPGNNGSGYFCVNLWKNGEQKQCTIHRLVAQAFLRNPNNLPQVNHIDEDKTNNKVENLEWCSSKYNTNFGTRNQRAAEKLTNGKLSKPVLQYSKGGEFIQEWKSTMDVKRNLGFNNTGISSCCNEKRKSAYGFVWKYKN